MRLVVCFAAALAALGSARSAHADGPPVAFTSASGLTASASGGELLRAMPVWREAGGALIALSEETEGVYDPFRNLVGIHALPPQCWSDATVPGLKQRDLVTLPIPSEVDRWSIAAAPDETIAMRSVRAADGTNTLTLYRVRCDADSAQLGPVTLTPGPAGELAVADLRSTWPLSGGVIHVVTTSKRLLRIDSRRLTASLIASAGDAVVAVGRTSSGAVWVIHSNGRRVSRLDGETLTTLVDHKDQVGLREVLAAPGLGGVLFGVTNVAPNPVTSLDLLAIEPEDQPFGWRDPVPPWPLAEGFGHDGFIGSADGTVWTRGWHDFVGDTNQLGRRYSLRAMGLDPARADFDRDGLVLAEETTRGTSDRTRDSDGDGFDDLYELQRATDPRAGSSHPPVTPTGPVGVAQSVFPVPAANGAVCRLAPPQPDAADGVCAATPYPASRNFTPDGRWYFGAGNVDPITGQPATLDVFDTTEGSHVPFIDDDARKAATADLRSGEGWAITRDAMGFVSNDRAALLFTVGHVLRFIDVERAGCPVVHDDAELAACPPGEPGYEVRDLRAVGVVGDMLVVRYADRYYGAGAAGVFDLGDLSSTSQGLQLTNIVQLPDGHGYFGQAQVLKAAANGGAAHFIAASILYDAHLRKRGDLPYIGTLDPLGGWDGAGYRLAEQSLFYKRVLISQPCDTDPWNFDPKCGTVETNIVSEHREPIAVDVRVVPEAIEAGEIILASEHTYVRPPPDHGGLPLTVVARNEDGAWAAFEVGDPIWRLWRLTKNGALSVWLSAAMFAAHADAAGALSLAETPLGNVTALRARADGARLCLTEGGRAWELTLVDGVLAEVTLVGSDARACAYDDAGRLALLSAAGIDVGGRTLTVSGDPIELVRTAGGWLVNDREVASCVLDDGTRVPLDVKLVGISEAALAGSGAVMTVDDHGAAWIGTDPCHGKLREELLYDGYLWAFLYEGLLGMTQAPETHVAFAQRPDGTFVVSGGSLEIFPARLLWWFEPAYRPTTKATRVQALDPFRRAASSRVLLSQLLTEVVAMTVIPGGDAGDDWGHAPRPAFELPDDLPDDGEPDDEAEDPELTPGDGGGGCQGGVLDPLLALASMTLAAAVARTRRR